MIKCPLCRNNLLNYYNCTSCKISLNLFIEVWRGVNKNPDTFTLYFTRLNELYELVNNWYFLYNSKEDSIHIYNNYGKHVIIQCKQNYNKNIIKIKKILNIM